jgi:DNA-binding transcriptional LysR family regulator
MELRQLEHFVAAAEERHFTRAARRSNIVQSGLSASIRSLEEELGAALFVRTTRQVDLTAEGRAFLVEARRVLAAVDAAHEAVAAIKGLVRGTLTIGVLQRMPPEVMLPHTLSRFHAAYPGVEIRVKQGASPSLVAEVRDGLMDLAFAVGGQACEGDVRKTVLMRDPFVLACPLDHVLAQSQDVGLADLEGEAFIDLPSNWATRMVVDQAFANVGLTRRTAFEMNEVTNMIDFIAHGLGVSLVPRFVVVDHSHRVALVNIQPPLPPWELVLVTPQDRPPTATALAFEKLFNERELAGTSVTEPVFLPA